ncbi:ferredoxin--NADP reductase, partial [Myxococcota bacterium]|nr:ferredoxin--NADP reductase [Myxococcota bacterium]
EFNAGQFLRLGVDLGEREPLSRPYSVASAPGEPLEFFIVRVEGGALTPRLFDLPLGAELKVHPRAGGVFTLGMVPDAETLWFISTGTGLAPFVSMLRQGEPFARFERVVVVQCVRQPDQLCYLDELSALAAARPGRLTQVNLATRAPAENTLFCRITQAFEDGRLEQAAEASLTPERAQVMLCGNPEMVADMQTLLGERGMRKNRKREPGHITVEKYW